MASKIIIDQTNPLDLPVETQKDTTPIINPKAAR